MGKKTKIKENAMKHIIRVYKDGDDIKLMVNCWHCNRTPLLGEEDAFCEFCGNEIEETNIAAWTEYEKEKQSLNIHYLN